MAQIVLKNAADIMQNLQNLDLKDCTFYKKDGCWHILDRYDVKLDMHLFNTLASLQKLKLKGVVDDNIFYKLTKTGFEHDARYFKELLKLVHNRKFYTVIDLNIYLKKFGYTCTTKKFDNTLPAYRCLFIEKGDYFELTLPYYTNPTVYLNKDALFKALCQIVCTLYFDKNIYPYSVAASAPIHSIMRREWQLKFDFVAQKVLEWTKRTRQS